MCIPIGRDKLTVLLVCCMSLCCIADPVCYIRTNDIGGHFPEVILVFGGAFGVANFALRGFEHWLTLSAVNVCLASRL